MLSTRFKLHLVVKDDTDTCNVMLLGSVAKSIIGHKAEDLWDGSYAEVSIMMFVLCRLMIIHFCETKTILWIDFDT